MATDCWSTALTPVMIIRLKNLRPEALAQDLVGGEAVRVAQDQSGSAIGSRLQSVLPGPWQPPGKAIPALCTTSTSPKRCLE